MTDDILKNAIHLIKTGHKEDAAFILDQFLCTNPNSETGWLWMAACVDGDAEKSNCLRRVLEINPENSRARQALQKLEPVVEEPTLDSILAGDPAAKNNNRPVAMPISRPVQAAAPDLITAICPSCGGQLQVDPGADTLICQYCGNEHLVRHNQGSAVRLEAYARCPMCRRNDRVEKVSAIIRNQTTTSEGFITQQKVTTGPGRTIYTKDVNVPVQTTQTSDLARRLAPPVSPKIFRKRIPTTFLAWGILSAMIGFFLLIELLGNSKISTLIYPFFFLIVSAGLIARWYSIKNAIQIEVDEAAASYQTDRSRWEKGMARWEKLYYCGRDDIIFIPGEKTNAAVAQILDYISNDPRK